MYGDQSEAYLNGHAWIKGSLTVEEEQDFWDDVEVHDGLSVEHGPLTLHQGSGLEIRGGNMKLTEGHIELESGFIQLKGGLEDIDVRSGRIFMGDKVNLPGPDGSTYQVDVMDINNEHMNPKFRNQFVDDQDKIQLAKIVGTDILTTDQVALYDN